MSWLREPEKYVLSKMNPMQTIADSRLRSSSEPFQWFAMSATFGRELKAREYLEGKGVRCFIPMRWQIVRDRRGGKVRKLVPAISNLLFACTTRQRIQSLKSMVEYLQYLTRPSDGKNVPVTIPDWQMEQFMRVCDTYNEKLVYLAPDEINLAGGTPVRIVGSAFDGVEGTFVRVGKGRKRQVVVLVQGVAAVMVAEFADGYLEVLE